MVIIILPHALVLPRKVICKDSVAMPTRFLNKFIVLMRGLVLMQILLRVINSAAMLILLGVH